MSKWFGQKVAVSEVSVSFGPGITGLLGPNGAGKTTLMRLITGLQVPSAGSVSVLGVNPRLDVDVYRRLALVPEEEAVYGSHTAREFITLSAKLSGLKSVSDHVERAIDTVDLADSADRKLEGFSKGMRQRAKVAAALVTDPTVLVLDEPLNGADPVQRAELIALFKDLGERGRTIIVSSHVLSEVERMAGRVVAMVDGRLAAIGTLAEIRSAMTERPRIVTVLSSQPRPLASALTGVDGVVGIGIGDDGLTIQTTNPIELSHALPQISAGDGIGLSRVQPTDESLETVFRYLMEQG
ncbi:MAG: ATP-binding cassette domain-containing protein [Acidimicrobiia bacterium]|nr:ATP-binding cassette domain-containing protein [Acidimicrobiia bacterium]